MRNFNNYLSWQASYLCNDSKTILSQHNSKNGVGFVNFPGYLEVEDALGSAQKSITINTFHFVRSRSNLRWLALVCYLLCTLSNYTTLIIPLSHYSHYGRFIVLSILGLFSLLSSAPLMDSYGFYSRGLGSDIFIKLINHYFHLNFL